LGYYAWIIRKMYMEEGPDMSKVKEPRAMVAVLVFAMVFIVGFGIWPAPILQFASNAVPHLSNIVPTGSSHLSNIVPTASSHLGNPVPTALYTP
jgi:formate hydrogenlyase subunit 3/multisubunit Na+/H+ antiporter MnhD subunit